MENFDNIKTDLQANPFSVPDGYFESFTDKVMQKIDEEKPVAKFSIVKKASPYISIAATFLIIFTFWHIVLKQKNVSTVNPTVTDIEFVINNELDFYDISESQLHDFVVDTATMETVARENVPLSSVDTDEIIDYLLEEEVGYEAILAAY